MGRIRAFVLIQEKCWPSTPRCTIQLKTISFHKGELMQHPPSFSFAPGCALLGYVALEAPFMAMAGVYLSEFTGGAFSYIAPSSRLSHTRVGRYCSIGDLVATLSQHPAHALTTSPITYNSTFPPPFDSKPKVSIPRQSRGL